MRIILNYMLMRIICNNFLSIVVAILSCEVGPIINGCYVISAKLKRGLGLITMIGHGLWPNNLYPTDDKSSEFGKISGLWVIAPCWEEI